jgi:hypothetical protein
VILLFKLYGKNKEHVLLGYSNDESEIIDLLGTYIGCLPEINYIIIESTQKQDILKKVILSMDDYIEYKYSKETDYKPKIKTKIK